MKAAISQASTRDFQLDGPLSLATPKKMQKIFINATISLEFYFSQLERINPSPTLGGWVHGALYESGTQNPWEHAVTGNM